ncbi:MAG: Rieske 2Fe-2S domain-containing protein [Asticcacaulis sp.]
MGATMFHTAEIEHIFKPSWLCVGFIQDLKNHNDFIAFQMGTHSIVVQNFKGQLKAFRNVCSHRFSRIQTEPCGNRRLQCPYHAWLYDADGIRAVCPTTRPPFGLTEADRAALALKAYALETCGHFVFVRMKDDGPDLHNFLGQAYDELVHSSEICPDRVDNLTLDVACNWKTGVENGIEAYHFPSVHKDSFADVLETDVHMNSYGPHCTHEGRLTEKSRHWWDTVAARARLKTSDRHPRLHQFPDLSQHRHHFTAGAFFTFQMLVPASSTTMRITSTGWLPKVRARRAPASSPRSRPSAPRFAPRTRPISETAQRGVGEAGISRAAILGEVDNRIRHFQQAYAARMELADV